MPDTDYEDETEEQDSPVLKDLRRKLREAEEKAKRVDDLEKKVAISEAGLTSLNEKQRKALLSAHDGDLTPEALQATAADLGFVKPEEPKEQIPEGEQQALQRIAEATSAAPASEAHAPTWEDKLKSATSLEESLSVLAEAGMLAEE